MDLSGDFLMEFLNVCSKTNLQRTIDLVVLLFVEIIGLKVPFLVERLVQNASNPLKPGESQQADQPSMEASCSVPLFLSNLNF